MVKEKETFTLGSWGKETSARKSSSSSGKPMKSTKETIEELQELGKRGVSLFQNIMRRAKDRDVIKLEREVNKLESIKESAKRKMELLKKRSELERDIKKIRVMI